MNYQKYSKIPEALQNKIISAAYGDASIKTKIEIWRLLRNNEEAKQLYLEYKSTADAVKKLEPEECPHELVRFAEKAADIKEKNSKGLFSDFMMIFVSKPIASAAVTGIAILLIVAAIFFRSNGYYNDYSKQELTKAELETKESLLIVSRIFNRTKNTVEDDVLTDRVAKPIQEGINFVNKIISEGELK